MREPVFEKFEWVPGVLQTHDCIKRAMTQAAWRDEFVIPESEENTIPDEIAAYGVVITCTECNQRLYVFPYSARFVETSFKDRKTW